jgi:hypothetical protein
MRIKRQFWVCVSCVPACVQVPWKRFIRGFVCAVPNLNRINGREFSKIHLPPRLWILLCACAFLQAISAGVTVHGDPSTQIHKLGALGGWLSPAVVTAAATTARQLLCDVEERDEHVNPFFPAFLTLTR